MLTSKTQRLMEISLTSKKLRDEMAALVITPGVPSSELKNALKIAMADSDGFSEVLAALSTPANLSVQAEYDLKNALASNDEGQNLINEIES